MTHSEAEAIAAALAPRWAGITGQQTAPTEEQLTDLVQWVARKTAEKIEARESQ